MISTEQLRQNQQAVRAFRAVGCGTCKGTGLRHKWDAQGLIRWRFSPNADVPDRVDEWA